MKDTYVSCHRAEIITVPQPPIKLPRISQETSVGDSLVESFQQTFVRNEDPDLTKCSSFILKSRQAFLIFVLVLMGIIIAIFIAIGLCDGFYFCDVFQVTSYLHKLTNGESFS